MFHLQPCEIDQKGECGGSCPLRDEYCDRYKVEAGGPDPWPDQQAYQDASGGLTFFF